MELCTCLPNALLEIEAIEYEQSLKNTAKKFSEFEREFVKLLKIS